MFKKINDKVWTVLGISIFIIVIYLLTKHADFITELLIKSGPKAPIIALILYPLLAITPITTDPITIVIGVAYGPFVAALIAFFGNTTAAMIEYYFGLKLSQVANFEKIKKHMPFGLGKMPVNSIGFLVFGRMIPGYGSKIISILAAAYKVPLKRYLWTTAVTGILGSLVIAYGGFGIIKLLKH